MANIAWGEASVILALEPSAAKCFIFRIALGRAMIYVVTLYLLHTAWPIKSLIPYMDISSI